MQAYKQIEKELDGVTYRLSIYQDESPESPREWDNAGKMVCWHRGYTLGDEQPKSDVQEWLASLVDMDWGNSDVPHEEFMKRVWEEIHKQFIILPLYLYDHSGITMSTSPFSCPWDSGQVGYIYISKKDAVKEWGKKRFTKTVEKKATKYLTGEVKTYDQYLRGDIYGFVIERKEVCNKGHTHWEQEDSCWGFYGSDIKENGMTDHWDDKFVKLFKEAV